MFHFELCFTLQFMQVGPIKADALLCSQADSVVENGTYETNGVCVSLGLGQAHQEINQVMGVSADGSASNDHGRDSFGNGSNHGGASGMGNSNSADSIAHTLSTVLSKKVAFLQFDGRSTVEVDESGIFISIPTFDNTAPSAQQAHGSGGSVQKPQGLPPTKKEKREIYPNSEKNTASGNSSSALSAASSSSSSSAAAQRSTRLKMMRRGLRIPANAHLRVSCAQPLSLVLTVPIKRDGDSGGGPDDDSDNHFSNGNGASRHSHTGGGGGGNAGSGLDEEATEEAERMRRFLSSGTVSIPWTYEGHDHSPEAYLQSDPNLSYDDKQEILREAERDSVIFANTICSLAEFISALPEGTSEICICFSCPDRLVRDTMVLSLRALAAMPPSCTRHERRSVFPWLAPEGGDAQLVAAASENEQLETKKVLKAREEENQVLKRERNELTVQLLASREELVSLKNRMQQLQNQTSKSLQTPDKRNSGTANTFAGFGAAQDAASAASATGGAGGLLGGGSGGGGGTEIGKGEAFKQLSSKIIELENKLAIATKREVSILYVLYPLDVI